MGRRKVPQEPLTTRSTPPALTPEARENQLIALAYDLAEQRIRNGTASAQEVTHFLKAGSAKAKLEQAAMIEQQRLTKAKTESLESAKRVEELYSSAMTAFRTYAGLGDIEDEDLQ